MCLTILSLPEVANWGERANWRHLDWLGWLGFISRTPGEELPFSSSSPHFCSALICCLVSHTCTHNISHSPIHADTTDKLIHTPHCFIVCTFISCFVRFNKLLLNFYSGLVLSPFLVYAHRARSMTWGLAAFWTLVWFFESPWFVVPFLGAFCWAPVRHSFVGEWPDSLVWFCLVSWRERLFGFVSLPFLTVWFWTLFGLLCIRLRSPSDWWVQILYC